MANEEQKKSIPGVYANVMRIMHSPVEFIIDFGVASPEVPEQIAHSVRVVMSPQHAKATAVAMVENLIKYEKAHGKIGYPPDDQIMRRYRDNLS